MRALRRIAAGCLVCSVLAACGGSSSSPNSAAGRPHTASARAIFDASRAAADRATSVHVVEDAGTSGTLDMILVTGRGGRGTFASGGLKMRLIWIGKTAYLKGNPALYSAISRQAGVSGDALATRLHGRWLRLEPTAAGAPAIASSTVLGRVTSIGPIGDKFMAAIGPAEKLTQETITAARGQKVVEVRDPLGNSLRVPATGTPYPIQLLGRGGPSSATVTFDRWDSPVALSPPAHSADGAQL
ncbi:MAG TPA: hypothetical protein VG165_06050 [Solirubrobacteraceae bacterium]|nr:hypothetical protein [Solirubrobacteraceae bacterium]